MTRRPSPLVEWRALVRDSDVSSSARLVALMLSTHMDRNGGSCFPSLTTQQRDTRLGRNTVCRKLDELETAKLIRRVRQGRGRPTRYVATSPTTGLALVPPRDSGSPTMTPEDVHEDVHNYPAASRRRGKAGRGRRPAAAEVHADPRYLDEAGAA